ncbi:MAG TPA: iron ABC transporter permease, partial [Polyangiaceae bacterium]|nr:iron ABC transporter permease [Polyangiaceae bacterium]
MRPASESERLAAEPEPSVRTSAISLHAGLSPATHAADARSRRRGLRIALALALFTIVSFALGLWTGRGNPADPGMRELFLSLRAYRMGVAFFAGGAIAVGGAIVQGLVRNPLASPEVLGTNAGALLGGKLALFATFILFQDGAPGGISPEMMVPVGCMLGAVLSLATVLSISSLRANTVTLILTGFVLNGFFLSIGVFVSNLSQDFYELNRAMSTFASGSISGSGARQLTLVAALALAGTMPALLWSSSLDLLLSGEEEAAALGVEVSRVRFWCVVWASLMTAGAVAVGASVGFIGLIIPHVVRRFTGPAHRHVIPGSFVLGGGFLILCDALCRGLPLKH